MKKRTIAFFISYALTSLVITVVFAQQQPAKLKFEFTTQEAETILRGLEALPYRESAPVIQVLITQAQKQSAPLPPPEQKEEKKADSTGKSKPKGKNRP